ncbi:MAG TPA: hypothetical protein V6C58_17995 [Allocoleopsis sp.]
MQSLPKLLKIENSQLAKFLKANLIGLNASLKSAKDQFPNDAGAEICDQLLIELEQIIASNHTQIPESLPILENIVPADIPQIIIDPIPTINDSGGNQINSSLPNQLDERLNVGKINPELLELGKIITLCLNMIETDNKLQHCYQNIHKFGIRNIEGDRPQYINFLIDYFKRICKAETEQNIIEALKQRINLDEAINSLRYDSINSDGEKMQKQARDLLFQYAEKARQNGHKIILRNLSGAYSEILKFSKEDLGLDIGGMSGEIITCLRVYAKIDQQETPGRVLYRF